MSDLRTPIQQNLIGLIVHLEKLELLSRKQLAQALVADQSLTVVPDEAGATDRQTKAAAPTHYQSPPLGVSVKLAARALGVGRNAIYEAIRRGEIPVIHIGRRMVVPLAALELKLLQSLTKT